MSKSITGTLHFFDNEPHVVGTLIIDGEQYELAGIRHSKVRTSFKARRNAKRQQEKQGDLFDENASGHRNGKRDLV